MADSALGILIDDVKQLVSDNINLILEVKEQTKHLQNDLNMFKAFLKDSTVKRRDTKVYKELVKQIRELVYTAEDSVETYVSEAAMHKSRSKGEKFSRLPQYLGNILSVAKEIRTISQSVKEMLEMKDHFREQSETSATEEEAPIVEEDNVVGFDHEAEKVITLLTQGSHELEVISIVGMPGLGKTTLAKMIFRDPRIKKEFSKLGWGFVSPNLNKKKVFQNILDQVINPNEEMYNLTPESLAKKLCSSLENEKYLIVIDDVWKNEQWGHLKVAFPKNKNRSRILLTTRNSKVAMHANPTRTPHQLRLLNDEESWKLLRCKGLGLEYPRELEILGKSIAKKCDRLPLAIDIIGGILQGAKEKKWEKVERNVNSYLYSKMEKRMKKSVATSFNQLHHELKVCFIYVGMFPKYFKIPVSKLVRLWIAEGFIRQNRDMSLEDTAEDYFEKLVNMNLVMVGEPRSNGEVKTCQVHGKLHEFCKKKASKEFSFQEFNGVSLDRTISYENCRRVATHFHVSNTPSLERFGSHIRSFLCFPSEENTNSHETISSIPKDFKLLRVLDGLHFNFSECPDDLAHLINLRYLNISSNFNTLPSGISHLQNIQTLIVKTSSPTLETKAIIWKMIQLRHFETNASTSFSVPLSETSKSKESSCTRWSCQLAKTDKSKNDTPIPNERLQTLSTISPESCTEDVIGMAPKLKKLGIRGQLAKLTEVSNESCLFDRLEKLYLLENLKLVNDVGKLTSLPTHKQFPPKLRKLTLSNTQLDWVYMSTLGLLPKLEILKLKDNAFLGEWWKPEDGGFSVLKVLHIGKTDLVSWEASAHHFPRLRHLYIKDCSKLEAVPLGLANVSSLKIIDLYNTTKSAADSAKEIQQITKVSGFKLSISPSYD